MFLPIKRLFKRVPLIILLGILTVGSWAFAARMAARSGSGGYAVSRVSRVLETNWGKNVVQQSPSINSSVYYDKDSQEPINSEEDKVIAKNVKVVDSKMNVNLNMDYRRKGLFYFPTFVTEFNGVYKVKNDSKKNVRANVNFPLPAIGNLVWNVEVMADGSAEGSVISSQELSWSGLVNAGEEKTIVVRYSARGMDEFSYTLADSQGLQNFDLNVNVNGAERIDFPQGALSPINTVENKEKKSWSLNWKFNNVLASPNISVRMYAKNNISEQVSKLFWIAPVLMIGLLLALLGLAIYRKIEVSNFDLGLAVTLYASFYPLLAYVVSVWENLNLYQGLLISGGILSLILVYLYSYIYGLRFAIVAGVALQVVFMFFFPLALLTPALTGLLFVVGVIAILATVVQLRVSR